MNSEIIENVLHFITTCLFWTLILFIGLFIGKTTFTNGTMIVEQPFVMFSYFGICFIYLYFKN